MCTKNARPLRKILEHVMNLSYDEEPNYDKIVHMFVCELLERNSTPHAMNYDWIRNPHFYSQNNRTRADNIDEQNQILSDES